jgi:hypothetical protein
MTSGAAFMLPLPPPGRKRVQNTNATSAVSLGYLTELVYELLDAQGDTILMAAELDGDQDWAAHVNYLQGLQRVGRAALARVQQAGL